MKGAHKAKVFSFPLREEVQLPFGWKPFAGWHEGNIVFVICRKWEQKEEDA